MLLFSQPLSVQLPLAWLSKGQASLPALQQVSVPSAQGAFGMETGSPSHTRAALFRDAEGFGEKCPPSLEWE